MFQQNIASGPGTEVFSSYLIEIVIMLLGAAILGFIIAWLFKKSYKDEFFTMKAEHDKCPGIKAGLENTIRGLETNLADCRADLEKARGLISGLTLEKEVLQTTLNAKISSLDEANASIAKLKHEIKTLMEDLSVIKKSQEKNKILMDALTGEKVRLNDEIKLLREELSKT